MKMIVLESSEELFRNETIVLVSKNPRCFRSYHGDLVLVAHSDDKFVHDRGQRSKCQRHRRQRHACRNAPLFLQLFLCSSRACLGKTSVFSMQMAQKRERETFPHRKSQQAHATGLPYPAARLHVPKRVFSRFSSGEYLFVTKPVLANCRFRRHRKMQEKNAGMCK